MFNEKIDVIYFYVDIVCQLIIKVMQIVFQRYTSRLGFIELDHFNLTTKKHTIIVYILIKQN